MVAWAGAAADVVSSKAKAAMVIACGGAQTQPASVHPGSRHGEGVAVRADLDHRAVGEFA